MSKPPDTDVTRLLHQWRSGDADAEAQLFEIVLPDLKRLAGFFMGRESRGHTLTATALLSETYLRLKGAQDKDWENRRHFINYAAQAMRHFLVDYARARPKGDRVSVDPDLPDPGTSHLATIVWVHSVLAELEAKHPELAAVVKMKVFLGMTDAETANALDVPLRSVQRRWHDARDRLFKQLGGVLR